MPRSSWSARPRSPAISGTRFCGARGVITHSTVGRITSALISSCAQTRRPLDVATPQGRRSGRSQVSSGRHQPALPSSSAPLACHRCCHVRPGCAANQSSKCTRQSHRRRPPAAPNGVLNRRSINSCWVCSVAGHDDTAGLGGNRSHNSCMSGPIAAGAAGAVTARAAESISCGAVLTADGRTARRVSPAGRRSTAPAAVRRRPRRRSDDACVDGWARTPAMTSPGIGVKYSWVVDKCACPSTH